MAYLAVHGNVAPFREAFPDVDARVADAYTHALMDLREREAKARFEELLAVLKGTLDAISSMPGMKAVRLV